MYSSFIYQQMEEGTVGAVAHTVETATTVGRTMIVATMIEAVSFDLSAELRLCVLKCDFILL